MGTRDTGGVAIANNLLNKCHINLQVRDVIECDAHVFVALYEAILGEKVPDYILSSRGPEDDAHNVQSVIDSLALDYLQVSLSHITGENIVRGDAESIQNLLEIFDGLLEYLTEQISEVSSQNGDDLDNHFHSRVQQEGILNGQGGLKPPPSAGNLGRFSAQSSEISFPSWDVDGSESTAELIKLGDTAHTFTVRGSDLERLKVSLKDAKSVSQKSLHDRDRSSSPQAPKGPFHNQESPKPRSRVLNGVHLGEMRKPEETPATAIPLNPPYQPDQAHRHLLASPGRSGEHLPSIEDGSDRTTHRPEQRDLQCDPTGLAETSPLCHKKVAFRTLPEIRFMTQSTQVDHDSCQSASEEEEESADSAGLRLNGAHRTTMSESSLRDSLNSDGTQRLFTEEPISVQRARNKLSEQELKEMSEKLARRLDALDQMLKKALGEQGLDTDPKEEDKLSQHSDSIMEFRRKKQLQAVQHSKKLPTRPRSLSSSPIPHVPSLSAQFEDVLHKEGKGEMGRIRREVQKGLDQQRVKSQMLNQAYEEELKDLEDREMAKLSKLKARLKKSEQECKENIFKQPSKRSQAERIYSRKQTSRKPVQWRQPPPPSSRPPTQMKIKDNDMLPVLLDEFPHLQISPHTLNTMWKGQSVQIEQLSKAAEDDERSERRLQQEVNDAHKKQELLVDLIKKEQEHKQRLKDFKDRIRLQKTAQNKMKENRQQVARAKRYYDDYHVQLRAKMMRARTREERIVKKLFADGLELQKQRLREMRSYAKELREEQRKRHKDELESMENYYKDQFSMLAEAVTQERHNIEVQEKVQGKTLQKMKRELRAKMEREIQELQEMIIKADEDAFFRELDADRLKKRLEMASFQYSKSHGL
ncbi:centrosomal protein of 95 kDa [Pelobates fuscus]|uniref:centrosomal protein of 95 kDa n=1 Tax=Pelobates fuscus TaxID=191477 RepID=UPI002FE4D833